VTVWKKEAVMLEAFATPHNRTRAFIYLAACCALAVGAAVVGISDNPPGIALAFLSAAALILAFAHPWRTAKRFRHLFYAAGAGFIVFAILHNLFDFFAAKSSGSALLHGVFTAADVAFFLVAILICPPALLIGFVGSLAMSIRNRHSHAGAPAA
jgi:hypothetical protein